MKKNLKKYLSLFFLFIPLLILSQDMAELNSKMDSIIIIETIEETTKNPLPPDPFTEHYFKGKKKQNGIIKIHKDYNGFFVNQKCEILTIGDAFKKEKIKITTKINNKTFIPKILKHDPVSELTLLKISEIDKCKSIDLSTQTISKDKILVAPAFIHRQDSIFSNAEVESIADQTFVIINPDEWKYIRKDIKPNYDMKIFNPISFQYGTIVWDSSLKVLGIIGTNKVENKKPKAKVIRIEVIQKFISRE